MKQKRIEFYRDASAVWTLVFDQKAALWHIERTRTKSNTFEAGVELSLDPESAIRIAKDI